MKGFSLVIILLTFLILLAIVWWWQPQFIFKSKQAVEQSVIDAQAEVQARVDCQKLCYQKLDAGINLDRGPCLSDKIVTDWVCDVAHSPRQPVDDEPKNKCAAFGRTAKHFVEVTANCGIIKAQ